MINEKGTNELSGSEAKWFEQKLDHLTPLDTRTFQQLYYVNDTYYQKGGPILLFLGGEGPLSSLWVKEGLVLNLARQFNGMVVALEHRYYGQSQPFSAFTVSNLKYLSSLQALHDIPSFRRWIIEEYKLQDDNNAWISFGCSYSGSLSLWLRNKFPNLIDGAYSGSSPVQAELNYAQYDETCEEALGYSCKRYIEMAFDQIKELLNDKSGNGLNELESLFYTCQKLDSPTMVKLFKYNVISLIQFSVQYNNAKVSFPRNELCLQMARADDKLQQYAKMTRDLMGGECFDLSLDSLKVIAVHPENNGRTWWWQKATEFAYYKNSPSNSNIFFPEINGDFHNWVANQVFDTNIVPNVNYTNMIYGAKNPDVSNVIITNGVYDPWSKLSILKDLSPTVTSVLYSSSGHCAPVYPVSEEPATKTPQDVLDAIQKIQDFVQKIIETKA
ncbi:serine protease [Anaeramoeba flamelloides]|uniref:Serine protease n=1 Tax=Anaeramoeba flamelloides TaxID=1746091 RepID=A0AAV7Z6Z2_9EUKA|nr:serine protease [Anaeramoeba flamelloides]